MVVRQVDNCTSTGKSVYGDGVLSHTDSSSVEGEVQPATVYAKVTRRWLHTESARKSLHFCNLA